MREDTEIGNDRYWLFAIHLPKMQDPRKDKMEKILNTIHISAWPIWNLGIGKGRVSTYLPLKALSERGHRVWFLTSYRTQQSMKMGRIYVRRLRTIIYRSDRKHCATISTYIHLPFFAFAALLKSLVIGLRHKPDVVYAHDIYAALPAFIISRILSSRYVLRLYGVGLGSVSVHRFTYMALKLPAHLYIITNDGTSGRALAQEYNVPLSRISFWVNGIPGDWPNKLPVHKAKNILSSDGQKVVLSVSRLSKDKQVDILIKAIPEVVKVYKQVRFVIVGDGDQRAYLEKLANTLGVSPFVSFAGSVLHEQVREYMTSCDVFVSLNVLSSICNPVLEAMSCGKPVIALNTGATSDLIKNGQNGILIGINEIDKLAHRILLLLKDDNLRRRVGDNSQRFILYKWPSWETRVNLEVDVIEALCLGDSRKLLAVKEKADIALDITYGSFKQNYIHTQAV